MRDDDDIVFSAKTGRQIVPPSDEAGSNVIPFPRGPSARPKPDPLSYAERATAIDQTSDDLEDI